MRKISIFICILMISHVGFAFCLEKDDLISNNMIHGRENSMKKASARHILVDSKEACEDLKSQIEKGTDFEKIAKEHSKCPSGKNGGSLGEFTPGTMVKEFDDVVFSAELNKVQGPVKTDFGYHLIEVTSRTD